MSDGLGETPEQTYSPTLISFMCTYDEYSTNDKKDKKKEINETTPKNV